MTVVNAKVSASILSRATQIFERMGIDQSIAINMFYRQVVAERGISFYSPERKAQGELIWEIIQQSNTPIIMLDVDEHGRIIIDKEKDPDLYDWAVNG